MMGYRYLHLDHKSLQFLMKYSSLTTITIPASITSISQYAFQYCSSLISVIFESGSQLSSIGYETFRNSGLKTITISASVTSIESDAFDSSSTFTIYVEYGNTMNPRIATTCASGSCYAGSGVTIVNVNQCSTLTNAIYLYNPTAGAGEMVIPCADFTDTMVVKSPISLPSGEQYNLLLVVINNT